MTSKEKFIKRRMEELKGIPKYANSEIQRRTIAEKEWEEENAKSRKKRKEE